MIMGAIVNNFGELVMGTAWSGPMLYAGYRIGKWRTHRKLKKNGALPFGAKL